jgi:phage terminase large subunit-like protein
MAPPNVAAKPRSPLFEGSTRGEAVLLAAALADLQKQRAARRQIEHLFPDDGPLRRELYPKHLEFFRAGAQARERLFISANRIGKTKAGCFEDTLHLTGLYDTYAPWWEGRRFPGPIRAWVCGTTDEKVKETLQEELFGPVGQWGTGLIPGATITKIDRAMGGAVKDLIDTAYIQHANGGNSILQFKSYNQGREAYEGTFRHLIHGDEEMPMDIKGECLLRTMDVGQGPGLLVLTFTPLQGLSEVVLDFLPDGQLPQGEQTGDKYVVNATWDDVPHLSDTEKATLLRAIPAFQRDARTRGLPVLGAGVIYPVPEDDYLVDPFELPKHWLRAYGMDVGWNWTAGIWGAYDQDNDTWYLYYEYKRGEAELSVHATALRAPGEWIRGVIDPSAAGRTIEDGIALITKYQGLGLQITPANNAVSTGLYECWERLSTGRLKVFRSLSAWRSEARLYRRDEKGRVVKVNDHLMDAMRYLVLSGREVAQPFPVQDEPQAPPMPLLPYGFRSTAWMGH